MRQTLERIDPRLSVLVLGVIAGLLLLLLPAEQTLGAVIKVVFLHGALVQASLFIFAVAGVLGIVYLIGHNASVYAWLLAAQRGAVILWIVYALASMVSTYLAWGEWIAWSEPRVQASFHVLWFSLACLALVWWVNNRTFTALVNIVLAVATWILVKGATIFRHPFNPIGTSNSPLYQGLYALLVVVILLLAMELVRWLRRAAADRPLAVEQQAG